MKGCDRDLVPGEEAHSSKLMPGGRSRTPWRFVLNVRAGLSSHSLTA